MTKDEELEPEAYHVGLAGEPHRAWKRLLLDAGAEKTDDGGWTLTDCFLANDYDPNTNPGVLPAGTTPAEERKQSALRLSRLKGSYALLLKRVKDKDLKQILATSYLQDGFGALTYMDQEYDRAITVTALRKMNKEFDEVTIKTIIPVSRVQNIAAV